MAKYDWKIEKRDEDWSDDLYAYFLIHINIKKMAEILNKEFKKDWWFKADFGNDVCYLVAENNDFPVRLFFTFEEDGWAKITRHYTDGASYKDETLGNWHFAKYDIDYSFGLIKENVKNYFNKFEETKGDKSMKKMVEKRGNTDDEKLALAQFLDIDVDEVEDGYTDHVYEADGEEYFVSDYDTAYEQAVEDSEAIFDEMGLEAVTESTQEYFLENEDYCSYPWEDDMHESNLAYCQDIDSESGSSGYATRLVEEAIEEKVIKEKDCFENEDGELDYEDKDELAELLADKMDENYDSMSEWFETIYGRGWAREMKDTLENYLDYHAMAEYCVDVDSIAHTLARYDGEEHTEKVNGVEYYIYRTN